jgi:hypothetical protein
VVFTVPAQLRDRFLAWLVTGPVGRLTAFLVDLTVALATVAWRRLRSARFRPR